MTNVFYETQLRNEVLVRATAVTGNLGDRVDRAHGCLIGGAIGDALGAPVEFMSRQQIIAAHGSAGLQDLVPAFGKLGAITDDTQMTLFTAEGLLRAVVRTRLRGIGPVYGSVTDYAYARWLITQGETPGFGPTQLDAWNGWLITHEELFSRRAPGNTCLSALRDKKQAGVRANNSSKGCGGVMRVAPVGLLCATLAGGEIDSARDRATFDLACELAGLTHGHASGQLPAGYLAVLIALLAAGRPWTEAVDRAQAQLTDAPENAETTTLTVRALDAASRSPWSVRELEGLGEGWVAEEALGMALYCAASAIGSLQSRPTAVRDALLLSVNHGGDSDSTGSITGNILGAFIGYSGLPSPWREAVELATVISQIAEDLATFRFWDVDEHSTTAERAYWSRRYPGF